MNYSEFAQLKGRPLSEMNEGSDKFVLIPSDALEALSILEKNRSEILGGDIITETETGQLIYAYQDWGSGYHYLNWHCMKAEGETHDAYLTRGYKETIKAIGEATAIAKRLNKKIYIVYVIANDSF